MGDEMVSWTVVWRETDQSGVAGRPFENREDAIHFAVSALRNGHEVLSISSGEETISLETVAALAVDSGSGGNFGPVDGGG